MVRCLTALCFLFLIRAPAALSADSVRATLGKDAAWAGEAVPLTITLYSPGPFAGTAAFELPDLPRTAIIKEGNPVVGSEQIDGETFFTQQHRFTIYTQLEGTVAIPGVSVRFSGKRSFTSAAEPIEGVTMPLEFESKRPPGSRSMGVVVTAREMHVQQSWVPQGQTTLQTGDILKREVTRMAAGTTGMMFPPVAATAPGGVRVHPAEGRVADTSERGVIQGTRTDVIRYQFTQAGTVTLPAITFVWWHPESQQLESKTVDGITLDIHQDPVYDSQESRSPPPKQRFAPWILALLGTMCLILWLGRNRITSCCESLRMRGQQPETIATKKLRAACRRNDPSSAYVAFLEWRAARKLTDGDQQIESVLALPQSESLGKQWTELSRQLFAADSANASWNGPLFWKEFSGFLQRLNGNLRARPASALPPLNPQSKPGQRTVAARNTAT